ncbi:MAG: SLC13 family permease [Akkermansia sp.]
MPFSNIDLASITGWLDSAATQQWIVGILLILLFISFIREWLPVEITALAGTAVLMLTGILTTGDVLSSFANSGPLTVVCMFILSASLERTGLIGDLSKLFNKVAKGREFAALLVITLGAFAVSPFVNNTPVVVILMPIVLAFCRDHNIAASKLLIPSPTPPSWGHLLRRGHVHERGRAGAGSKAGF